MLGFQYFKPNSFDLAVIILLSKCIFSFFMSRASNHMNVDAFFQAFQYRIYQQVHLRFFHTILKCQQ